jgi:hypothetical protein
MGWIRRFVIFHQWRKPSTLEPKDVHELLRHLAMEAQVAFATQNQALNAVVFLYRKVVKNDEAVDTPGNHLPHSRLQDNSHIAGGISVNIVPVS